jgi:hypothetical protein
VCIVEVKMAGYTNPDMCDVCGEPETPSNPLWLFGYYDNEAAAHISKLVVCCRCFKAVGKSVAEPLLQRKGVLLAEKARREA